MKKIFISIGITLAIITVYLVGFFSTAYFYPQAPQVIQKEIQAGGSVLYPQYGGTGTSTTIAANVGKYLKVSDDSPFTYSFDTPSASYSGFGTDFYTYLSATTTDYLAQGSTNFYASQTRFDNLLSATTSVASITTLSNLSILKAQVSDFGTYLLTYDAFTHPAVGQSATTSLMVLNGNASTTQISSTGSAYFATSDGNVGIGTTNPAGRRLRIQSTSEQLAVAYNATNASYLTTRSDGNFQIYAHNGVYKNILLGVDGAATNAGNVGIGTTGPNYKLEVNGTASSTSLALGNPLAVIYGGTGLASGYNNTNWDTAFGWGNHAVAGYLPSSTYYNGTSTIACVGSVSCGAGSFVVGSALTITGSGLSVLSVSTSTIPNIGNLAYWTGAGTPSTLGTVATTSLTASLPLALSQPISVIGSSASALSISTAGTWSGLAGTATALAADPADCSANTWSNAINASGTLTCSAITYAGITAMTSANLFGIINDETGGAGVLVGSSGPTLTGVTTLANASSTVWSSGYASSTAGYFGSITMTGNFTPNASFGGRSITVNGSAVDADAELYTRAFQFTIATTSMATSTAFNAFQVPVAMTITQVSGFCKNGTTTVGLDERATATPKTAGTDIFDDLFEIGDYAATSTFTNASISAGAWVNLDIDGYLIGNPVDCRVNIKGTVDD